ncbi:MAG: glycerol kinase GlpK [Deinococcus sp.]|nr:glycerol kinase GlpK [Deinococcus sp.]
MADFILALDQGTTSSRSILFDRTGRPVRTSSRELRQIYPRPGWVEHDPEEIWQSQLATMRQVMEDIDPSNVAAVGITNQRETTILWDRHTGKPLHNAIVWQCRRTAARCEELRAKGYEALVREHTGLVLDAYFSGTKLCWLLDNVPGARERAAAGELAFGTVDSWLLWNLTGGAVHATDYSNASRTMLFNISTLQWDQEMISLLDVPSSVLPKARPTVYRFGELHPGFLGAPLPVSALVGDQQAALAGHQAKEGEAKNTYGTGSFLLLHTGNRLVLSQHGLLTTVAWGREKSTEYALEGSTFITGAAVQWLRDGLGIIANAGESAALAQSVPDTGGVYFVPALAGLGAPYWDMEARGLICGISRASTKAHLVRATLEAIAYLTRDVLDVMSQEAGLNLSVLKVDGGASANNFLMQFQADILGIPVRRSAVLEVTALGAAYLASQEVGFWREGSLSLSTGAEFRPTMEPERRELLYQGWKRAVARARG